VGASDQRGRDRDLDEEAASGGSLISSIYLGILWFSVPVWLSFMPISRWITTSTVLVPIVFAPILVAIFCHLADSGLMSRLPEGICCFVEANGSARMRDPVCESE